MDFILTKICEKIIEEESRGKHMIKLHTVDFNDVDKNIIKIAQKAINKSNTGYSSSAGLPLLRKALAYDYGLESDNVVIGAGSRHLLFSLLSILFDGQGQNIIVPDPEWAHFLQSSIKNKIKRIPGHPISEDVFFANFKKAVNKKTKALLISNPNNPTGCVFSNKLMGKISSFCYSKGIYLIVDCAYEPLSFTPLHQRIKRPTDILLGSFSKGFSMTGFRIGYLFCVDDAICKKLIQYNYNTIQCCPIFTQKAALYAWQNKQMIWKRKSLEYKKKFKMVEKILIKNQINYIEPSSGPFIYLPTKVNSEKLCLRLIKRHRVAFCPGTAFGSDNHYIRLSLTAHNFDIKEGIDCLIKELKRFG